jgi:hypothetical protein
LDEGFWEFRDYEAEGDPKFARVDYELEGNERSLTFTSLFGETNGDELTFLDSGTHRSILYYDVSEDRDSEIEWDEATGVGSIQVPDYNGGERGCWNELLDDVPCEVTK